MAETLEDDWQAISPYLDQALELDGAAREAWIGELTLRAPAIAAALRSYLQLLEQLEREHFLEGHRR